MGFSLLAQFVPSSQARLLPAGTPKPSTSACTLAGQGLCQHCGPIVMQAATAVPNQRGDRRGQQGGARRADPPSPPPPPPASRATLRKIECAAAVLAAAVQILVYRRTFSTVTPRAHAHQLALVALHIAAAAVVCLAPHRAWQVWRVPAVALLRALIVSVPSYRSITVRGSGAWRRVGASAPGAACHARAAWPPPCSSAGRRDQPTDIHLPPPPSASVQEGAAMLMHRPASPGVGGATLDYLHMAMGSRQLLSAVFSGLLHHPPWAVAAQQALHVLLTGSAGDYCR